MNGQIHKKFYICSFKKFTCVNPPLKQNLQIHSVMFVSRSRWGLPYFCCPGAHSLFFDSSPCAPLSSWCKLHPSCYPILCLPAHLHSILSSLSLLHHALVFAVCPLCVVLKFRSSRCGLCYLTLSCFVYFF